MMQIMRIIFPEIAVLAPLLLAACQPSQDPPFAKVVPSAVIEIRDEPTQAELDRDTQVVMLGTGTPVPDAYRAGPSIAIIHKGEAYLFDVGAGAIQNAAIARYKYDIPSLYPSQICCVFLTHMHSDHTMDYSELAFTLWWRRRTPISAWGPVGLEQTTNAMFEMMAADTALRASGVQPLQNPDAYKVNVTEIEETI
jgi:ribonuclease BN (tRNA processing enzyme)